MIRLNNDMFTQLKIKILIFEKIILLISTKI